MNVTWMVSWTNQSEAWISRWARVLKGTRQKSAWTFYAADLAMRWGNSLLSSLESGPPIMVVTPSLKHDHAYFFGKMFSQEIGCGFLSLPWEEKVSVADQKTKSRQQRKELRLTLRSEKEKFIKEQKDQLNWVFIDDIWTTGTTAEAVYDALGKPRSYRVLTLFRRLR